MRGSKQSLLLESSQRLLRRGATARVKQLITKTRPEDLASIFPSLLQKERHQIFNLIPDSEFQAEVLSEMEESLIPGILKPLTTAKIVAILHEVPADDVADILATLPTEAAEAILEQMQTEESLEVEELLGYDPESAGGIMSPEFFALPKETTVEDAIKALQEHQEDVEMAFYVYVVNEHGQLTGIVSLRQLVTNKPGAVLNDIAEHDTVTVPVDADQEDVAQVVARYNFLAVPVVDASNKLLGIVTVDDIIDVLYEEATEDILKLAGAGSELPATAPLKAHFKMRYPWLFASCLGGFLAAFVMDPFIAQLGPFLALFVPVVMGMAGNVGIQSSTIVVRGLATGHIDSAHIRMVVRREVGLGLLLGICYGTVVGLGAGTYSAVTGSAFEPNVIAFYGVSVGTALAIAMMIASTLGTIIPLSLNKIGIDPAVATGPFVTTALDVLGLLSYFMIALLLSSLMLN